MEDWDREGVSEEDTSEIGGEGSSPLQSDCVGVRRKSNSARCSKTPRTRP